MNEPRQKEQHSISPWDEYWNRAIDDFYAESEEPSIFGWDTVPEEISVQDNLLEKRTALGQYKHSIPLLWP